MIPRFALHKLKNAIERQRAELKLSNRRYAVAERFKEAKRKSKEQKNKISDDVCTITVRYKYGRNPSVLTADTIQDLNDDTRIKSVKVWESYYQRGHFNILDIVQTVAELEYDFISHECGLLREEYLNLWADYIYGSQQENKGNTWSITIDTSLLSIAKWNHSYDYNLVETEEELLEKIKDEGRKEDLENYRKDQKALQMICREVINYISDPGKIKANSTEQINMGFFSCQYTAININAWRESKEWPTNEKVLMFADEEKIKLVWLQDIIFQIL